MRDAPCRSVRVRVPATSANLGPGFDALGLGLSLYDEVVVSRAEHGVRVEVSGEGELAVPRDDTHLVARAAAAAFEDLGHAAPGLALTCVNRIPHGRGLGSSAAAIVAGLLAARALVAGGDDRLPAPAVVRLATAMEGHPDNAAACLLGGLTIAWSSPSGPQAVRVEPHPDVVPVLVIPGHEMSTKAARALLPTAVPHEDAAANAGRAAVLVTALTTRPDLLLDGTEDRLHQDYRRPAMPETLALVHTLRRRGMAAAVSGAGPTVIVFSTRPQVDADLAAIEREAPSGWQVRRLDVDRFGARVEYVD